MKRLSDNTVPFRLRAERKRLGGTQAKWAQEISVSEKTWRRWESGESPIPSDYLVSMASYGFDVQYILIGTRCEHQKVDKNTRTLTDYQIDLLDSWRHIPEEAQVLILSLLKQLIPHTDMSGTDEIEFIDPDRVHDMTPEEHEVLREKRRQQLKAKSHATVARKKRIKASRRKKTTHKEKEKV
ncbi:MAG: helix-turn-helix transcriptional regulator [Candidatus Thiodiazotropha endolucinida]